MKYTKGFGVLSGCAPGGMRESVTGQNEGLLETSGDIFTFPICTEQCVSSFCRHLCFISGSVEFRNKTQERVLLLL